MSFPRYPAYKNSGVEWLGDVPEHWVLSRLGHYFEERRERASDKEFRPLSVTKNGVVPQLESAAKTQDGDNRKKVIKGDFVINSRSDRKGSAGTSPMTGSVSLICTVIRPIGIYGAFANHLLRSEPFQEEYYRVGKGIVADLWSTNYSEMKNILLCIPSTAEQAQIACFLDHETDKIDTLIEEQQRLIDLLKEKRQAVISHAVTKGLDTNVPMKDSGVEWLGEVPAHWDVVRVKHVIQSIEQGWSPQCDAFPVQSESEWGVLKVGCVNGGVFRPEENKSLPVELEPRPALGIREFDLLVSRANTRELVGSAAVASDNFPNLLLCDKLYRMRIESSKSTPQLLAFYLGASPVRGQIELMATGASSSMLNIGQSVILDLAFPCPPLEEQRLLCRSIEKQVTQIEAISSAAQTTKELLLERRAALISAAVTGKIDVRDWHPPKSLSYEPHPEDKSCLETI